MTPSLHFPRVEVFPDEPSDTALAAAASTGSVAIAIAIRSGRDGTRATRGSSGLARRLEIDVAAVAQRERAGTKPGDVTRVPASHPAASDHSAASVFLVGVGDGTPAALRTAAASLIRSLRGVESLISTLASGVGSEGAQAIVEGTLLGAYRVARIGQKPADPPGPARVQLIGMAAGPGTSGRDLPAELTRGRAQAGATNLARELANTRSSTKHPAWLAARARQLARTSGLDAKVWSEADLRREGFDAIRAVGGGAEHGPRLVQLDYQPGSELAPSGEARPHIVLVGKGITFDTGGISLKPREAMLGMTTDMTGAAVVLAVLAACRDLGVRTRVSGLMPLAENAFDGGSYRPADVVRTYDGTTVEVRNTDAEGRMVLADAIGYARTQLRPDLIVDIATLTGAATLGLGRQHAALYATDDRLGQALVRAGEAAGELLWRMPLVEDYRADIDSEVADICQISTRPKGLAGSIMAALFLREFAGDVPWAHLDIAGPGRSDRDRGEINRGGTGFGARLLLRWLQTF